MNKRLQKMIDNSLIPNRGGVFIDAYNQSVNEDIAGTITTRVDAANMIYVTEEKDGMPKIIERDTPMKGNYEEPIIIDDYNHRIPEDQDVIGTVVQTFSRSASGNGYKIAEPLRIKQATKQGYIEVEQGGVFDATYPDSTTRRGRVQEGGTIAPTLMASGDAPCRYEGVIEQVAENLKDMATKARGEEIGVTINDKGSLRPHRMDKAKSGVSEFQVENEEDTSSTLISARPNMTYGMTTAYRIRKLTPRECFRLMGVCEEDIDKIQASGVSNSQQYKMAGNSIVVDVLYHLFDKMFVNKQNDSQQMTLF